MADKIKTRQEFEPIIYELNSELREKYNDFVGITFFGSRYRGDFSEESDFDIVIMFSKKPAWQKESDVDEKGDNAGICFSSTGIHPAGIAVGFACTGKHFSRAAKRFSGTAERFSTAAQRFFNAAQRFF